MDWLPIVNPNLCLLTTQITTCMASNFTCLFLLSFNVFHEIWHIGLSCAPSLFEIENTWVGCICCSSLLVLKVRFCVFFNTMQFHCTNYYFGYPPWHPCHVRWDFWTNSSNHNSKISTSCFPKFSNPNQSFFICYWYDTILDSLICYKTWSVSRFWDLHCYDGNVWKIC